jgi:hypothetical protein
MIIICEMKTKTDDKSMITKKTQCKHNVPDKGQLKDTIGS